MQMKKAILSIGLLTSFAMTSCKTTAEQPEGTAEDHNAAASMLAEARQAMAEKRYADARNLILDMREQHPYAVDVRREAILTLDSVDLLETRDSIPLFEAEIQAARDSLEAMPKKINGQANQLYLDQKIRLFHMEQHLDELSAKAKFFIRKLENDFRTETSQHR